MYDSRLKEVKLERIYNWLAGNNSVIFIEIRDEWKD